MLSGPEDTVETLVADDRSLREIEQYIDELPFDEDRRSALWLLAWTHRTYPVADSHRY